MFSNDCIYHLLTSLNPQINIRFTLKSTPWDHFKKVARPKIDQQSTLTTFSYSHDLIRIPIQNFQTNLFLKTLKNLNLWSIVYDPGPMDTRWYNRSVVYRPLGTVIMDVYVEWYIKHNIFEIIIYLTWFFWTSNYPKIEKSNIYF